MNNNIFNLMLEKLPHHPSEAHHGIWVNGNEEIMCETEEKANTIADLFEDAGYDVVHTNFYDFVGDGLYYGWWSVYPD